MKCPIDETPLAITERQGVEIDYCPQCRGVWLDRGELDKIIDKSEQAYGASTRPERRPEPEYRRSDHDYNDHHPKKKKRESFLGDLFEF